jgi:cytochrome c peroxidase
VSETIDILRKAAALLCLALVACEGDTIIQQMPEAQLDRELAAALEQAGVDAVARPQPEDPHLVALGRALFFDKELSGNRNISCATCHHPAAGTGDALPVSIGEGGDGLAENRTLDGGHLIPRNAPHVFNGGVSGVHSMFWDSRVRFDPASGALKTPEPGLNGAAPTLPAIAGQLRSALAAQAMFPVTSHEEMRGQPGSNEIADAPDNEEVWTRLMARLGAIDEYRDLFLAAFPTAAQFDELNFGHAARAIAAFERESWTALDSPFDRYLGGDKSALSVQEKRGAVLYFGKAKCGMCHGGPLLTDFEHHALAVPQVGPGKNAPGEDLGLALETNDPADNYKFRTPALRNVALTGPWMHDGCFTSLEAAVRHHFDCVSSIQAYDRSQLPPIFRATVDEDHKQDRIDMVPDALRTPMALTEAEIDDLIAFLHALTDPASLNLSGDVPDRVPSGLPVAD